MHPGALHYVMDRAIEEYKTALVFDSKNKQAKRRLKITVTIKTKGIKNG